MVFIKGHIPSDETRKKLSEAAIGEKNGFFGRKHTFETLQKMHAAQRNIRNTPEWKRHMSDAQTGKKLSDETKQKMSNSHKDKKHNMSDEGRRKLALIQNNRIWTEESKMKISLANRGNKHTEDMCRHLSFVHTGKPCAPMSKEQRNYLSESRIGHNNPNWNGGTSFFPYCEKFNTKLKERIRTRDNRICQLCGIIENGKKHAVHHIHYDKENCFPDLITLCNSCNLKVNRNKQYYEILFMNKLNEKGLLFWTKRCYK